MAFSGCALTNVLPRVRPTVKVKLNGISSFRPLVRYGKKGLMLLVR